MAFALFVAAMITDKIDGDIARSRNLVTNFGKIADPIADKAITGMAFIGLSIVGDIWWWVTIVVLIREWSVTLLRLSVLKQRRDRRPRRAARSRPRCRRWPCPACCCRCRTASAHGGDFDSSGPPARSSSTSAR